MKYWFQSARQRLKFTVQYFIHGLVSRSLSRFIDVFEDTYLRRWLARTLLTLKSLYWGLFRWWEYPSIFLNENTHLTCPEFSEWTSQRSLDSSGPSPISPFLRDCISRVYLHRLRLFSLSWLEINLEYPVEVYIASKHSTMTDFSSDLDLGDADSQPTSFLCCSLSWFLWGSLNWSGARACSGRGSILMFTCASPWLGLWMVCVDSCN